MNRWTAALSLTGRLPAHVRRGGGGGVKRKGRGLYMEVGCNRLWRGEEPVALETASMELARLAGEPLTVG